MNTPKYITAFKKAYLKQQNLELTDENWEISGTDGELILVYENENYFVIVNKVSEPMFENQFLNIVNKKTLDLTAEDL